MRGVDNVNVVVSMGQQFTEADLAELRALDPRLRVDVVSREARRYLGAPGDGSDPAEQQLNEQFAAAEVLFAGWDRLANLDERAPKLRWVAVSSAGVDYYVRSGIARPGRLFTGGSGPSATPIGEYVLMAMLMLAKNAHGYVRQQAEKRWEGLPGVELRGKTVGIVGLGSIGGEAGRLARAVGCRVIGSRRSATEPREDVEGVDLLLPPTQLPRLLAESDFVVVAAPATPETAAIIDAEALAQMKPSAYLINIARGSLVDERALTAALKEGRIAGAALDVVEREPLSPESELWDLPNVIVTPHRSSTSEHTRGRQAGLFKENLRRYLAGEDLINLVDLERGY
jgi:phosphoglycerate dehydrogenase-like enzyme